MNSSLVKRHTLDDNVLGLIEFNRPVVFMVVYPEGKSVYFRHVIQFKAMKTGCSVLTSNEGVITVLVAGHHYYQYWEER